MQREEKAAGLAAKQSSMKRRLSGRGAFEWVACVSVKK